MQIITTGSKMIESVQEYIDSKQGTSIQAAKDALEAEIDKFDNGDYAAIMHDDAIMYLCILKDAQDGIIQNNEFLNTMAAMGIYSNPHFEDAKHVDSNVDKYKIAMYTHKVFNGILKFIYSFKTKPLDVNSPDAVIVNVEINRFNDRLKKIGSKINDVKNANLLEFKKEVYDNLDVLTDYPLPPLHDLFPGDFVTD